MQCIAFFIYFLTQNRTIVIFKGHCILAGFHRYRNIPFRCDAVNIRCCTQQHFKNAIFISKAVDRFTGLARGCVKSTSSTAGRINQIYLCRCRIHKHSVFSAESAEIAISSPVVTIRTHNSGFYIRTTSSPSTDFAALVIQIVERITNKLKLCLRFSPKIIIKGCVGRRSIIVISLMAGVPQSIG